MSQENEACDGTESFFHKKGDGSWWEMDARGIPLCRVCDKCEEAKLARFRPEVLSNANYEADEAIEED